MAGIFWLVSKLFTVSSMAGASPFEVFGLFGQRKKHSFHGARLERREALSIPGAKRSPKGRGSEHGAHLFFAPRGAAQAGLTEGAERSFRLRYETNVVVKRSVARLHREFGSRF
jgi:hypothetical protein